MANILDSLAWIRTSRAMPQTIPDTFNQITRGGRYGEQQVLSVIPTKHQLADEGSYFVWSNQSPGTTVAEQALKTAFSNTVGIAHLFNKDAVGGKSIFLDYVKLILAGTAPATTVSLEFAIALDNVIREPVAANRTILTGVNMSAVPPIRSSIAQVSQYLAAQAFTVAAPTANVRYVRGHIPTGLGITGDEYILKFGGEDMAPSAGLTATRAAAPGRFIGYCPPVIIDPGWSCVIHRWWLTETTTIPTFELEIGGWER